MDEVLDSLSVQSVYYAVAVHVAVEPVVAGVGGLDVLRHHVDYYLGVEDIGRLVGVRVAGGRIDGLVGPGLLRNGLFRRLLGC